MQFYLFLFHRSATPQPTYGLEKHCDPWIASTGGWDSFKLIGRWKGRSHGNICDFLISCFSHGGFQEITGRSEMIQDSWKQVLGCAHTRSTNTRWCFRYVQCIKSFGFCHLLFLLLIMFFFLIYHDSACLFYLGTVFLGMTSSWFFRNLVFFLLPVYLYFKFKKVCNKKIILY